MPVGGGSRGGRRGRFKILSETIQLISEATSQILPHRVGAVESQTTVLTRERQLVIPTLQFISGNRLTLSDLNQKRPKVAKFVQNRRLRFVPVAFRRKVERVKLITRLNELHKERDQSPLDLRGPTLRTLKQLSGTRTGLRCR